MKLLHLCVLEKVKVARGTPSISGYIFLAPCCPVSMNLHEQKSFYGLFLWPGAKQTRFVLPLDSFTFSQQDVSKHFFSSGNGKLPPICAWLLCFISLDSKSRNLGQIKTLIFHWLIEKYFACTQRHFFSCGVISHSSCVICKYHSATSSGSLFCSL